MEKLLGKDISHISKEELDKLSEEEREKVIYAAPRTILVKLRELHAKVNCLVDFYNILNGITLEDFKVPYNREVKEKGHNPAFFLIDYILLEIKNFYTTIHNEKEINFPEVPSYWESIRNYRNAIPGHADVKKKFKTNEDMLSITAPLDEIGMDTILRDFNDYFMKCLTVLKEHNNRFLVK